MPRAIGLDMCKLPTEDLIGSNFPVTLHLMMLHSVTTTVLPNYCPRPLLVEPLAAPLDNPAYRHWPNFSASSVIT